MCIRDRYKADALLRAGKAVIIACGVGYPYFSTDTGMVLRAAELKADAVLSAKAVEYVYDKDPKKYPDAKRYESLTYAELIEKNLQVIDGAAGAFARDNDLRILLFSLAEPENLYKAASGERVEMCIRDSSSVCAISAIPSSSSSMTRRRCARRTILSISDRRPA